jgi:16S rRNA (guanine527-N7)-methyltransferase
VSSSAAAGVAARLELYIELLIRWNERINLVARGEVGEVWTRHVADSLAVVPLIPSGARRIVDLGSGGGFPGLVVAISTGLEVHLIDRDQRKCAFLREAVRRTKAAARVHAGDFGAAVPVRADLAVSRATAPLSALLDAASRHVRTGGALLVHKSMRQEEELGLARDCWRFRLQVFRNPSAPEGRLWRIDQVERIDADGAG